MAADLRFSYVAVQVLRQNILSIAPDAGRCTGHDSFPIDAPDVQVIVCALQNHPMPRFATIDGSTRGDKLSSLASAHGLYKML